jgi:HK97 family phage prohead protease
MKHLDFALETMGLEDDGSVTGLAVGYGNVDFGGDMVLPGAITKSMKGRKSLPMLLYHDQRQPVGVWSEFTETAKGLVVKGRFAMSTVAGKEAHALTKDGALGGLSMGYRTLKEKFLTGVRQIVEAHLHEVSLVTVPMNEKTMITGVKADAAAIRDRLAAGDRLTERELEVLLKGQLDLSNSEAERAVRLHFKSGQGEPGGTADPADVMRRLRAELGG